MNNLILDNDLNIYPVLIGSWLILTFSIYYLIISNNTNQPQNTEALINEEMEAIMNENAVNVINANIDEFTESDLDTDTGSAINTPFVSESETSSDTESILDDPEIFFMPNVDFNVCPIEELKHFEFKSLYARELVEHSISDDEIFEFLSWFTKEDLATNWINDVFLWVILQL